MIRLHLLGGLELTGPEDWAGEELLSHPKAMALLAYLALAPPKRVLSRDRLLSVFWPESDESRARNALSQILHRLRRGLGRGVILNRGRTGLSVSSERLWCDARAFEEVASTGEHAKALGLYVGHLLEGYHLTREAEFEAFVAAERARLRELAARSAWSVAYGYLRDGRVLRAERAGLKALELACTHEHEVRRFISALAESGDRAAAVRFYEHFADRLDQELDLTPDPSTRAMIGEIRGSQEADVATRPPEDPRPSIAALPWVNRSGREEDVHFTDGVHEEILGRLSRIRGLRVIARPSVMEFRASARPARETAARLGARYLLGGGLMRAQNRVRINVHLTDAPADRLIWAETDEHDLTMTNLLSVQAEMARRVAGELEAALSPEEEARIQTPLTANLEAYDLYLLGRHRWVTRSTETLRHAIDFYQAAVEQDPDFALAWAGLADAWTALPWYETLPALEALARARPAAQRALELDDTLAEAHTALGGLALYYEWDWDGAEAHLLRALELNSNYALAHLWISLVQSVQGRLDQAIDSITTGIRLNPLGNNYHGHLAQYLFRAGRLEEAMAAFRTAERSEPPVPTDLLSMSLFLTYRGADEEACRVLCRWGQAIGYPRAERLSRVLSAFGAPEFTVDALAVLEDLRESTGLQAGFLAALYLNLDAPVEALTVVREAIAQRHMMVPFLGMTHYWPKDFRHPEVLAELRGAGIPIG